MEFHGGVVGWVELQNRFYNGWKGSGEVMERSSIVYRRWTSRRWGLCTGWEGVSYVLVQQHGSGFWDIPQRFYAERNL